jgi:hypothetical protein
MPMRWASTRVKCGSKSTSKLVLKPSGFFLPAVAADPIDVAGDGYQCEKGSEGLHARARAVYPVSGYETGRPLCVEPGCSDNVSCRDAAQLFGPLWSELCDMLRELVEAIAPLLSEILVVELFGDEDVRHRQRDRSILPGRGRSQRSAI